MSLKDEPLYRFVLFVNADVDGGRVTTEITPSIEVLRRSERPRTDRGRIKLFRSKFPSGNKFQRVPLTDRNPLHRHYSFEAFAAFWGTDYAALGPKLEWWLPGIDPDAQNELVDVLASWRGYERDAVRTGSAEARKEAQIRKDQIRVACGRLVHPLVVEAYGADMNALRERQLRAEGVDEAIRLLRGNR